MASPNAFEVLEKDFKLTKKQFYYWRRKLTQSIPMPVYFDELKKKGYHVAFTDWPSSDALPPIVLLMSPQMQANYRAFGDCVSFDITYKVCSYYKAVMREG